MSTEPWHPNPGGQVPERLLRIGDSERERAAALLGEHFATGRLQRNEFDERLDAAYAARTLADLEGLFSDLPEPTPFRPGRSRPHAAPPRRRHGHPHAHPPGVILLPVAAALVALFVVLTILLDFPPFFLFFVFWVFLGRGRRRRVWL